MYFRTLRKTPGDFRIETTFDLHNGFTRFILEFPLVKVLASEILVRRGKIFLRPYKVDPTKPDQYRVEGFTVRNKSQRQDGTLYTAGGVTTFKTQI
jgi:hypothetical protein